MAKWLLGNSEQAADMAKAAARERLNRILGEHLNTIHETLQMLDQKPSSSLEKISWKEVIKMGDLVSKQATMVGMLYTGETPGHQVLEENMATYVNVLQGLLLHCHGSSVGAGPTLSSCILASVKQVVNTSFKLLQGAVSSYGSPNKNQNLSITQLVGTVWEACSALKKTPSSNVTAIGRAMTQVAVSVKDVLRELKELKPATPHPENEVSLEEDNEADLENPDDLSDDDLGKDLSADEMKVAQFTTNVVSETLVMLKELVRSITSLLQKESSDGCALSVDSLEKLLKLCQEVGAQVDEVGACLYPPQEISAIKLAVGKISSCSKEMHAELDNLKGNSEDFVKACTGLESSLRQLESQLCCVEELIPEMEGLAVSN